MNKLYLLLGWTTVIMGLATCSIRSLSGSEYPPGVGHFGHVALESRQEFLPRTYPSDVLIGPDSVLRHLAMRLQGAVTGRPVHVIQIGDSHSAN